MNIFDELISRVNRDNYPGDYDMGFSLAESIARLCDYVKNLEKTINEKEKDIKNLTNANEKNEEDIKLNSKDIYSITHGLMNSTFKNLISNYIYENKDMIFKNFEMISFYIDDNGCLVAIIPECLNLLDFEVDENGIIYLKEDFINEYKNN